MLLFSLLGTNGRKTKSEDESMLGCWAHEEGCDN